jgi:tRNA threonylcarbamoyl adenosine modification protein (Sua5/YciO/YrdC/YwlC family)
MSAIDLAEAALRRGEVVAVPTDTVYGLVATLDHAAKLFEAKQRPADVDLPVLVFGRAQAESLSADPLPPQAEQWPGPLTLVVRRAASVTANLGSHADTVGLRVPHHPVPRELARRIGPLASTSANLHGQPPATTAAEAAALGVLVVDGGTCNGTPSTVIDCTGPEPRVLRGG